jgi:hypothetical protein
MGTGPVLICILNPYTIAFVIEDNYFIVFDRRMRENKMKNNVIKGGTLHQRENEVVKSSTSLYIQLLQPTPTKSILK